MSFDVTVCRRLPLADATLRILRHVADDAFLADLYDDHRGGSYERQITFASLFRMLSDALLAIGPNAGPSFHETATAAVEAGTVGATVRAVYDKLGGLPIPVSCALLARGTVRLRPLRPDVPDGADIPPSLRGFAPVAVDGKKIKNVARRLRPARSVQGKILGGKLLVAEDVRTGLAVGLTASPDGQDSELILLPGLLNQVRETVAGPRLWIADGLYGDLTQPHLMREQGDHFLLRGNAKTTFFPDETREARHGATAAGQRYEEAWGVMGVPADKRRLAVRRVTVFRPGEPPVTVVTDLLDGAAYPAAELLAMYRRRWGIERLFQKITEVFRLASLASTQERGTVFQASVCLLLYNVTVLVRDHVAAGAGRERETVSLEKLFTDVTRQWTGLLEVLGIAAVLEQYADGPWTAERLRQHLTRVLGDVWRDWWVKAPPKKTPKPAEPKQRLKGGCESIFRIRNGTHQVEKPKKKPP